MRAMRLITIALGAMLLGATVGTVVAIGQEDDETEGPGAPAIADPAAPSQRRDMGVGERVYLVVGGVFPSREAAEEAAARMPFGELQGYYVAPVTQFAGLGPALNAPVSRHVLVSAFRTEEGAREFLDLARAVGAPGILIPRKLNHGDTFVGLGQEAHPDGSGPLQGPLEEESSS
jgi:hypothetical protein